METSIVTPPPKLRKIVEMGKVFVGLEYAFDLVIMYTKTSPTDAKVMGRGVT